MRRLLIALGLVVLVVAACSDDDAPEAAVTSTTTTVAPTTTTEAVPVDTTFAAEDVQMLCNDLGALADIDPEVDPSQADVDRLLAIADAAPIGVAEPLQDLAAFGQAVVDGTVTSDHQTTAVEAATILIAYGNEACGIDVPLFDAIAGV